VAESKESEAEALLEAVSTVEITAAQAFDLIGEPLPEVAGTIPYLTRAVYLTKGTGSFSVSSCKDWLHVVHGSLGSGGYRMKRQALVLQLDRAPAKVFVSCSMAK
jgi:hypothetical protein